MMKYALLLLFGVALCSCKHGLVSEYETLPLNPYDTLTYNENVVPTTPIDSNTFLGVHKYILATKCSRPGCHDGSFEPDYRTVTSAYNGLVYAPVAKNDADSSFTYRVIPGDTAMSWLHERITTEDAVLGRMPLYDTLPARQIKMISNWINDGAKDIFGATPFLPNPQPTFYGIVAYLTSNNMRVDSFRGSFFLNPFMVPAGESFDVWFGIYDDTNFEVITAENKIKLSTDPNNFDNAPFQNLQLQITPINAPAINGNMAPYYLHYTVNTSQYDSGDLVYMRVYVKDPDHVNYTELPSATSPSYYKTYFAFIVQ